MTEHDINVNYIKARQQSDELRKQADELRVVAKDFDDALTELEAAWIGQDAQRFVTKARKRKSRMLRAVTRLEQLAKAIDDTAAVYRRAEMQKIQSQKTQRPNLLR